MPKSKSRKVFIPDNGVTMKTSDGHLQLSRRDNVLTIRLVRDTIEAEQEISEISRDLKFSIHGIKKPLMILDVEPVQHMSSRMLGTLLEMKHRVEKRQGKMGMIRVQPALLEILAVTKLRDRLPIFDSFEQALQACSNSDGA
jgi:anti-anti-sigma factor